MISDGMLCYHAKRGSWVFNALTSTKVTRPKETGPYNYVLIRTSIQLLLSRELQLLLRKYRETTRLQSDTHQLVVVCREYHEHGCTNPKT